MVLIKNLYEKIKPYLGIIFVLLLIWVVTRDILGARRDAEQERIIDGIHVNLTETRDLIGDVLSDVSDIKEGVEGVGEASRVIGEIQSELGEISSRLETVVVAVGDQSTESGILADRLYRISREIAEREQETED